MNGVTIKFSEDTNYLGVVLDKKTLKYRGLKIEQLLLSWPAKA
jgi:hypothetical protein